MMEWLLIALVQTAAGDPNTTTSPAPAAETETAQTTQSAAQEERVCRRVYNTGSRLRYTWDCGRTAAEDNRREEE